MGRKKTGGVARVSMIGGGRENWRVVRAPRDFPDERSADLPRAERALPLRSPDRRLSPPAV